MMSHAPTGISAMPHLQWGSHVAQFFGAGVELRDVLVPYFKAGLENNERCLWVTGAALDADEARSALRAAVPNFDKREACGQIEIADAGAWYSSSAKLEPNDIVSGLLQREQDARDAGYEGLRTNGNCAWVSPAQWPDFQEYESLVGRAIKGRRMICMCSYCEDRLEEGGAMEVLGRHDIVLPSHRTPKSPRSSTRLAVDDVVSVLEALPAAVYMTDASGYLTYYNQAAVDLWGYRPEIGKQRWCGTWKILSFEGAHIPHDQCPMAIAMLTGKAIRGMEAQAERPDGARIPCAVYPTPLYDAAGKLVGGVNVAVDISHRKAEEARSAALVREMHHRVNNTLATVMSIMGSTFRVAKGMEDFRVAFGSRIQALSKTHALLSEGAQASVSLRTLLENELSMFADGDEFRVVLSGPEIVLPARVAAPVGMAIHELATNAAKYGALSVIGGRLRVKWSIEEDVAQMYWRESNVPMRKDRKRVGFGTRLLTDVLPKQIGSKFNIEYGKDGVRAAMEFPAR